MKPTAIHVRGSRHEDLDRVLVVHRNAFGDDEGPVIAELVREMLHDPSSQPMLSLVAESDDKLIGHVLFTSATVEPDGKASARILAPLAVVRDHQRQGIGSRLVQEGLQQLTDARVELVFVLGYPDYYSRFGFMPAGARGLHAPYPILAKNAEAWMAKELSPGAIENHEGTIRCSNVLNRPQYWQE